MSQLVAILALVLAALGGPIYTETSGPPVASTAPIKHVWIITLENESADTTYGPNSPAHYLNNVMRKQGVYLDQYYATGHASLDNYISMVSGQGPNVMTQADCQLYINVIPGTIGPNGQALGQGCVYPANVLTIADQLEAKGLSWKGYMQDMGNTASRESATCGHPSLNTQDGTQSATAQDSYATRHNPFMYFHSIIDESSCHQHVVALPALTTDLAAAATTPAFSFITPSLCEDGHDAPCADGRPGGLVSADAFLATWVPKILASPAYAEGGMVILNFDESELNDYTACCGEQPNLGGSPLPGLAGPGGGRTGAVIISQRATPNSTSTVPYNHYSLLRSLEDLFGLSHLGFAAVDGLVPFGADVYNATFASSAGSPTVTPPAPHHDLLPRTGGRSAVTGMVALAGALGFARFRKRLARAG